MSRKNYKTIECLDAHEFWEKISPINTPHLKKGKTNFIYRGQGNASWNLTPSIFRKDNPIVRMFGMNNIDSYGFVFGEQLMMLNFLEECDVQGIKIDCDSKKFREKYIKPGTEIAHRVNVNKWPFDEVQELWAVMQHCGVPTRLLDWSKKSFVAAYFAASDALINKRHKEDKLLAVWALNIEAKNLYSDHFDIVEFPGGISSNLAAQAGLFTLQNTERYNGVIYENISLESGFNEEWGDLFKITVPTKCAKEILQLCLDFGVSGSTLFPGFEGIRRCFWDKINLYDKERND